MKTKEEIDTIREKIRNGKKLLPSERMDGFQMINGIATDQNIHDVSEEETKLALELLRKYPS